MEMPRFHLIDANGSWPWRALRGLSDSWIDSPSDSKWCDENAFPDHRAFTEKDYKRWRRIMEGDRLQAIITTDKDAMRIKPELTQGHEHPMRSNQGRMA